MKRIMEIYCVINKSKDTPFTLQQILERFKVDMSSVEEDLFHAFPLRNKKEGDKFWCIGMLPR